MNWFVRGEGRDRVGRGLGMRGRRAGAGGRTKERSPTGRARAPRYGRRPRLAPRCAFFGPARKEHCHRRPRVAWGCGRQPRRGAATGPSQKRKTHCHGRRRRCFLMVRGRGWGRGEGWGVSFPYRCGAQQSSEPVLRGRQVGAGPGGRPEAAAGSRSPPAAAHADAATRQERGGGGVRASLSSLSASRSRSMHAPSDGAPTNALVRHGGDVCVCVVGREEKDEKRAAKGE